MSDHASILPSNRTRLEDALDLAVQKSKPDLSDVAQLLNPDTCPEPLLPWLAWAMSVDDWDASWPEETRRRVVATAIAIHRRKGTVTSLRDTLAAFGYGAAVIVEGYNAFLYNGVIPHDGSGDYGAPDHWAEYRIYLERPITLEQADRLKGILRNVAPARCHLKGLYFTNVANCYNAAIAHDGSYSHGVAA